MDLVFIYLSITLFIFVLVLTVSSLLPPTGLTPALAVAHTASGLCLCSEKHWGGQPGRTGCGTVHLLGVALSGYDS